MLETHFLVAQLLVQESVGLGGMSGQGKEQPQPPDARVALTKSAGPMVRSSALEKRGFRETHSAANERVGGQHQEASTEPVNRVIKCLLKDDERSGTTLEGGLT